MSQSPLIPLSQREMFSHFDEDCLKRFEDFLEIVEYPDGKELTTMGLNSLEDPNALFILMEGEVDVFASQADPTQVPIVRTMRAGEVLGLVSLMEGGQYTASCITRESCRVALLSKEHLARIRDEDTPLAAAIEFMIAHQLARDLRMCNRRLANALQDGIDPDSLPSYLTR